MRYWLVMTTNVRPSTTFVVAAENHDDAVRKALDATPHNFCMVPIDKPEG